MNSTFKIEKNKIIFSDTEIEFEFEIDYCITMGDKLIVLLTIPISIKYNENVYCVSLSQKKVLWQIAKRKYKMEPYTSIHCKYNGIATYDNKLRLNNWCDAFIIVDPENGNVLDEGTSR
jgi:hypothetical protein